MSRYRLEVRPFGGKDIAKNPGRATSTKLDKAFANLSEHPRRMGTEKLSGFENRYRYRIGDYRIVYEIHDAVLVVLIPAVGDRKEIYR